MLEIVEVAPFIGSKSSLEANAWLLLSDMLGLVSLLCAIENVNAL